MTMAIAWLPWVWLTFHQFWQTEKSKWILLLSICFSMQLLTDLRTFYITLLPLMFLTFYFIKKPLRSWFMKSLKLWSVSGSLALGLSAGQLLPFLELLAQSSRTALSFHEASLGSLHPVLLLGMLFPLILNLPEYYIFIGVSALVFGLLGLTTTFQKSSRPYIYLLVITLVMSLGSYTPIYKVLYAVVPGFSLLRVPARWWVIEVFLFTIFTAEGIDAWIERWQLIKKKSILSLITLAVFYFAGFGIYMVIKEKMQFNPIAAFTEFLIILMIIFAHKWLARSNLILIVSLFGLWLPSAQLIQPISDEVRSDRQSRIAEILENSALHGERSLTPYRYSIGIQAYHPEFLAADGYDSFHIKAYRDFVNRMLGCDFSGYSVSIPATLTNPEALDACPRINLDLRLAKLLNIRYLLLPEDHPFDQGSLVVCEDGIKLIDLGQGFGKAFGVQGIKYVRSQSCLDELGNIDEQATALVEIPLKFQSSSADIQIIERIPASNGAQFRIKSTGPFVLIHSEAWAPGWKAFDEKGKELEVFRADCALQGVLVEAGEHVIRFVYRPVLWTAGLVCTILFFACISCAMALNLFIPRVKLRNSKKQ